MIKKANILTVSVIAVMAVCSARADIASTTYVDTQVQSVDNKLTTHTGNLVTTEEAWIAANNANQGAVKYPSLSAIDERIGSKLDDTVGGYISKGSATVPVYFNESGEPTAITSYSGKAATAGTADKAVADGAGNNIAETYATKSALQTTNSNVSANTTAIAAINNAETGAVATAKEYTDSKVGDISGDLSTLNSTVSGHTAELSQITSNISTLNSGKQEKSTADYQVGKSGGGWTTLSADQIAAINSGATSGLIGKISTNETAINTLKGDSTVTGSVANSIASALTPYSTTAQMNTALAGKANTGDIPTKVSQLTNDSGFITKSVSDLTNYTTTTAMNTALAGKADTGDIPTKTSDLTNDSGFITKSVSDLTNYTTTTAMNTALGTKQDTLVTTGANANLAGAGTVSVDKDANGKITITGAAATIDSALSADSTNAVQNKVVKAALDGKQAAGNYITVPAATGTSGKSVLTYDAATTTYYWEEIGR